MRLGLINVIICLMFLVSCDSEDLSEEQSRDPLCGEKHTLCIKRMDWNFFVKKKNFPQNALVSVNGIKVVNECRDRIRFSRGIDLASIEIEKSIFLKAGEKISLSIRDLGNCYVKKPYYENANQLYEIKQIDKEPHVWVEVLN